jgi:putative heme transporter
VSRRRGAMGRRARLVTSPPPGDWWQSHRFQASLSLAVVAVVFGYLFPKVADYRAVWHTIGDMTWLELAVLTLVAAWNLVSYWPMLMAALPELHWREAAVSNLASTAAANTLPGGAAIGIGATATMQHSWGIPLSSVALASVVTGIWNNFLKLGLPVVALALVAATGHVGAGLVVAAAVGLAVMVAAIGAFAALLRNDDQAARLGALAGRLATASLRPLHRGPVLGWALAGVRFRGKALGLLRRRWLLVTVTTIVSHLSLYAVLLIALRDVGVSNDEVGWVPVLAAFAFVRLVSAIPVTPGGLGVVELGLTAALGAGLPDHTRNQVAAAVLVFRALTWLAPIPLGVGAWLFWRTSSSWRHTVDERRSSGRAKQEPLLARPQPATR